MACQRLDSDVRLPSRQPLGELQNRRDAGEFKILNAVSVLKFL